MNDVPVRLATPSSLKDKDLTVALQANMLTAVCDFICQDLSGVFDRGQKRKYDASGKYAKNAAVEKEEE